MKILFLSILISFAVVPFIWGQKDLSGVYVSECGMRIIIKDSMFYYIIPQSDYPVFYSDTLAKCTIQWVDDNFIELNSQSPHDVGYKGFNISQTNDSLINDSIKVSFSIPYQGGDLDISVYTLFKSFDLCYSRNNKEIMIPNDAKKLEFCILPERRSVLQFFYGITYFSSFEHEIEKGINCIKIELPALDDSFFERFFIKGEYAKISKSSIVWKGETFKKKK